jgi:hypothetical protein
MQRLKKQWEKEETTGRAEQQEGLVIILKLPTATVKAADRTYRHLYLGHFNILSLHAVECSLSIWHGATNPFSILTTQHPASPTSTPAPRTPNVEAHSRCRPTPSFQTHPKLLDSPAKLHQTAG